MASSENRQQGPKSSGGLTKATLNLDLGTRALTPATVPFAPVASGSGPRHMAFHPNKVHAYVLDKMASSVTVF